jgi:hypothetical protein
MTVTVTASLPGELRELRREARFAVAQQKENASQQGVPFLSLHKYAVSVAVTGSRFYY